MTVDAKEYIEALRDEIKSAEFIVAFWQTREREAREVAVANSNRITILQEKLAAELSQVSA